MVRGNKFKPGEPPLKKRKMQAAGIAEPGLGVSEGVLLNGHAATDTAPAQVSNVLQASAPEKPERYQSKVPASRLPSNVKVGAGKDRPARALGALAVNRSEGAAALEKEQDDNSHPRTDAAPEVLKLQRSAQQAAQQKPKWTSVAQKSVQHKQSAQKMPAQQDAQQRQAHAGTTANQRRKARRRALKLAAETAGGQLDASPQTGVGAQAAQENEEQGEVPHQGAPNDPQPARLSMNPQKARDNDKAMGAEGLKRIMKPAGGKKLAQAALVGPESLTGIAPSSAVQHSAKRRRADPDIVELSAEPSATPNHQNREGGRAVSSDLVNQTVATGGGQAGAEPAARKPQLGNGKLPIPVQTLLIPPSNDTAGRSNWEALKAVIGAGKGKSHNSQLKGTLPQAAADAKRPEPLSARAGPTQILAVDCEMVGVGPDGSRSSLARVCIVNDQGNVLMDKHVRQKERVTDYRTRWSGIRPANLRPSVAEPFEDVQREASALLDGRILVGHAISNDLQVLLLSHPKKMIRDTAKYPPLMRASAPGRKPKPRALRHLAFEILGLGIQEGEHSPVDDARAALYLYQRHRIEWEQSLYKGTFKNLTAPTRQSKEKGRHVGKTLADLAANDDMVDL